MSEMVSIVVPVCDQLIYTKQFLVSLARNTEYAPYEVVVVDNGSADGTAGYLEEKARHTPQLRVITNRGNLGFTLATNQGMREARGQYVVLANNDIVVRPRWLTSLVEAAKSSTEIGIVGPKILFPGTDTVHTIGGLVLRKSGAYLPPGRGTHRLDPRFRGVIECQYVEASCVLIKREVIERIGYFDEVFSPGYYEDTDYGFRARAHGFRSVCATMAEVYHYAGKTAQAGRKPPPRGDNEAIFRKRWGYLLPD